jgi:hypothetical protein
MYSPENTPDTEESTEQPSPGNDLLQARLQNCSSKRPTGPKGQYTPSHSPELSSLAFIPSFILFYLCLPEYFVRARQGGPRAIVMAMPEATVHKQRYFLSRQNRVRRPRQVFSVALELEPKLFK